TRTGVILLPSRQAVKRLCIQLLGPLAPNATRPGLRRPYRSGLEITSCLLNILLIILNIYYATGILRTLRDYPAARNPGRRSEKTMEAAGPSSRGPRADVHAWCERERQKSTNSERPTRARPVRPPATANLFPYPPSSPRRNLRRKREILLAPQGRG